MLTKFTIKKLNMKIKVFNKNLLDQIHEPNFKTLWLKQLNREIKESRKKLIKKGVIYA